MAASRADTNGSGAAPVDAEDLARRLVEALKPALTGPQSGPASPERGSGETRAAPGELLQRPWLRHPQDVATVLGVSTSTVDSMVSAGVIPAPTTLHGRLKLHVTKNFVETVLSRLDD